MFSWLKKEGEKAESIENVVEGLKRIYKTKLLPLELHYQFHDFHSPQLEDPDFDAKPMILLVGQYSTGKTTFIKYLLERDFPGIRIGPEPTTDRFIAVMHDEKEGVIPGNALVVDPKKQFRPLSKFGNAFLNRFQCSTVNSPVLKGISIVDTPGILSGEKQRVDRGYDFTGVLEWFAERVDRIVLLFDAHKLDISDEFRRSIEALRGHDDKIRIVLNKADMIDHQQLMRVYGALMWSLGKVLQTPEVARVYIGSFWDQPLRYDVNKRLFEDEEQDLFKDMQSLPRNAALRKLNDLIKRARLAKVHAYIVSELRKEMPSMFGKEGKKKELIKNLGQIYDRIQREQQISPGDFPDLKKMQESLANHDFTKFHPLKPKLLEVVDHMLATDIARLMDIIPQEEINIVSEPFIKGGAFEGVEDQVSPFGYGRGEGVDAGHGDPEWICSKDKPNYDQVFQSLNPVDGKVTGAGTHLTYTHIQALTQLLAHPHMRATIVLDKTLEALLSSTHNCSLLTELCMTIKKRGEGVGGENTDEASVDKIADTLSVATRNCSMITQLLLNARDVNAPTATPSDGSSGSHPRMSPAVSIHSLNDFLPIGDTCESKRSECSHDEYDSRKLTTHVHDSRENDFINADKTDIIDTDSEFEVDDVGAGAGPRRNLDLQVDATGFFHPILRMIYALTGERYIEFVVEKAPRSWLDKAKAVAFGPDEELVRIQSILELFYLPAKTEMVKSKLPNSVLGKIWKLADIDKDGLLDEDEFALAMHLIRVKIDGHALPTDLPAHLVPPSKRN